MSLTKKVYLTISGYDIKLSDNLMFYQNDQLKLIFYINEYGIDYGNNATTRALMPVNPLNAILFIENPDGVDSVSSARIEDNAVTFYLDSTHTQYVGVSRMQLRLFDQDGCAITLPHFTFEIRENIYGSGDVRFQNVVMVDQTGTVILTEDNDLLDVGDILTMGTEVAYPQVAKTIKELPIKHGLDGTEKLIVEDNEATKQMSLTTIVDEIKQNSQEKIREIESELAQTNAQLSELESKSIVSVIDYKDLCVEENGVIDWSNAFTSAWNNLKSGGILTIPNGVYHLNKALWSNKDNITVLNGGELRHIPQKSPLFGLITLIGCENCTVNNLHVNGTSELLIDDGVAGATCLLSIENCKNTTFNNLKLIDAQWTAMVLNGNCYNTIINTSYFENIGEHCCYLSGENNNRITFNDMELIDVCIHKANTYKAVINSRLSVLGGIYHDNLVLNRVTRIQNKPTVNYSNLVTNGSIKNITIKDVIITGSVKNTILLGSITDTTESILVDGGDIDGYLIYNISSHNQRYTSIVRNLKIRGHGLNFINSVNLYENCEFLSFTNYKTLTNTDIYKHDKIEFRNCNFTLGTNNTISLSDVHSDYIFSNCNFTGGSSQGAFFKVNRVDERKKISFINTNFDSNYAVFLNYTNPVAIEFKNCEMKSGVRSENIDIRMTHYRVENTNFYNPSYNYANINNYAHADEYRFNGVRYNEVRVDSCVNNGVISSGQKKFGLDLRNFTPRDLTTDDIYVTLNKPVAYKITSDSAIKNYFWITLDETATTDVLVTICHSVSV